MTFQRALRVADVRSDVVALHVGQPVVGDREIALQLRRVLRFALEAREILDRVLDEELARLGAAGKIGDRIVDLREIDARELAHFVEVALGAQPLTSARCACQLVVMMPAISATTNNAAATAADL